ncbi:Saccharopine dehydrogenase-domain-containing protein [Pestalotiopsis sp. NC0098]|nr:Saccharopine dehydrogenase-domain-containing protein [Pestalotiopsis sp. NC0098]
MGSLLIYGATGYTGRLVVEYAKSIELDFLIAGRSEEKTKAYADTANLLYRVFDLDTPHTIDKCLKNITVLLNCAGPFLHTAKPLIEACLRNGVHYLDTAAELDSYKLAEKLDEEAVRRSVMILPGCGGSVTILGYLARHTLEHIDHVLSIDIALHVSGPTSRGSAISAKENMSTECLERCNGLLQRAKEARTATFDFADGRGAVTSHQFTLPDVITLWRFTGVRNIRTFVNASGDSSSVRKLDSLPDGPTESQRQLNPYSAAILVYSDDGTVKRAVLHTINGYTFTALASVEAAKRVLSGEMRPGFQTSAGLFQSDFLEFIPETKIEFQ